MRGVVSRTTFDLVLGERRERAARGHQLGRRADLGATARLCLCLCSGLGLCLCLGLGLGLGLGLCLCMCSCLGLCLCMCSSVCVCLFVYVFVCSCLSVRVCLFVFDNGGPRTTRVSHNNRGARGYIHRTGGAANPNSSSPPPPPRRPHLGDRAVDERDDAVAAHRELDLASSAKVARTHFFKCRLTESNMLLPSTRGACVSQRKRRPSVTADHRRPPA